MSTRLHQTNSSSGASGSNLRRVIHPIAAAAALFTIASLWLSTVVAELFGSKAVIVTVKTTIPWALLLLIPSLAIAAGTGFLLAEGQRTGRIGAKAKRMPLVAANGLLILVPAALLLAAKARADQFDAAFYWVQGIELVSGATNLVLLGLAMRDGLAATAWKRRSFLRSEPRRSARVLNTREIAENTTEVRLEKPSGFVFRAGQAVYVTLNELEQCDARGRVRTFSIAGAPQERDLVLAMRRSDSSFKRWLVTLAEGATVDVEGPFGDLELHEDSSRPAVFIAGGIGITPFRSMILDSLERGTNHRFVLFYSNRTPNAAAYLAELQALQNEQPNFRLVATMTESCEGEWSGERGLVTREMLARHAGALKAPIYYVAGPPTMVSGIEQLLRGLGVDGAEIRTEKFAGY